MLECGHLELGDNMTYEPKPLSDIVDPEPELSDDELEHAIETNTRPQITPQWAMRKYRAAVEAVTGIQAEAATFSEPLQAELERIREWETAAAAPHERTIKFMAGWLQQWAIEQRTERSKSFPLIGGIVSTTSTQPKPSIVSMDAAVAYASKIGAEVKSTTNVTAIKAHVTIVERVAFDSDGEFVPNAHIEFVRDASDYDVEYNGADPGEGNWVVVDADGGTVVGANVVDRPHAVDAETGQLLTWIDVARGGVTANIKLT